MSADHAALIVLLRGRSVRFGDFAALERVDAADDERE